MNNYHFQKKNETDLEETIILNEVTDKVKKIESRNNTVSNALEDDLGDASDYLLNFQSEQFAMDNPPLYGKNQDTQNEYETRLQNDNFNDDRGYMQNQNQNVNNYMNNDLDIDNVQRNNREYNREPNREPNREYNREPNREPNREYNREYNREPNREPNREYNREPNREPNREYNREPNREPNREYNREPNREPNREYNREANREPNREYNREPTRSSNNDPRHNPNNYSNGAGRNQNQNPNNIRRDREQGNINNNNPNQRNVYNSKSSGSIISDDFFNKKNIAIISLGLVAITMVAFFISKNLMTEKEELPVVAEVVYTPSAMMIQSIINDKQLLAYDIDGKADISLSLNSESDVYYAGLKVSGLNQLSVGDIVMVTANDNREIIELNTKSDTETIDIKNVEAYVNDRKLVPKESGQSYYYHEKTKFYYKGDEIKPANIDYNDVLTATSYNNVLWVVDVVSSHGYLELENKNKVTDGVIIINDGDKMSISDFENLSLPEGYHTINLSGKNIEDLETTITIVAGETLEFDISNAQDRKGVIIVEPNISDYELYVDGKLMEDSHQAVLSLGSYTVKIIKEDYLTWEEEVVLDGNTVHLKPELEYEFAIGTTSINTNAGIGEVYIDNELVGSVPLELNLLYGNYSLRIEADGYKTFNAGLSVDKDELYVNAQLIISEVEKPVETYEEDTEVESDVNIEEDITNDNIVDNSIELDDILEN